MNAWLTNTEPNNIKMNNAKSTRHLIFCSAACFIAFAFGGLFVPGEWYTQINIAPWSPPNIVFPIVWSILYVCIAIAGWRIFNQENVSLKAIWAVQLILNGLWSWVFFGVHWVLLGFIDILLIISLVSILIIRCWSHFRICSYLLLPYLAWLLLASSLNLYILLAN